jgi:simple sugar transport system substrate-binding protein
LLKVTSGQDEINNNNNCTVPTLFSDPSTNPTIYVVMGLSTGEFFSTLYDGMIIQSTEVGLSGITTILKTPDNGDVIEMARYVREASNDINTVGIVTVGGTQEGLCDAIVEVIESYDIPVVSFDFDGNVCHPTKHVLTAQADLNMASLVMDQAVADHAIDPDVQVGYVSDLNYVPLLNRDNVWETYKTAYDWTEVFFVDDAANFTSRDELVETIAAALEDNPEVDFVYAPWDYLTGATLSALELVVNSSVTAVYGADINDEDISLMIAPGSLWKATAGGDPQAIGAALIRMVSILATDGLEASVIDIPSLLFTQSFLLSNGITSMATLREAMPELKLSTFMEACWITTRSAEPTEPTSAPTTSAAAAVTETKQITCILMSLLVSFLVVVF